MQLARIAALAVFPRRLCLPSIGRGIRLNARPLATLPLPDANAIRVSIAASDHQSALRTSLLLLAQSSSYALAALKQLDYSVSVTPTTPQRRPEHAPAMAHPNPEQAGPVDGFTVSGLLDMLLERGHYAGAAQLAAAFATQQADLVAEPGPLQSGLMTAPLFASSVFSYTIQNILYPEAAPVDEPRQQTQPQPQQLGEFDRAVIADKAIRAVVSVGVIPECSLHEVFKAYAGSRRVVPLSMLPSDVHSSQRTPSATVASGATTAVALYQWLKQVLAERGLLQPQQAQSTAVAEVPVLGSASVSSKFRSASVSQGTATATAPPAPKSTISAAQRQQLLTRLGVTAEMFRQLLDAVRSDPATQDLSAEITIELQASVFVRYHLKVTDLCRVCCVVGISADTLWHAVVAAARAQPRPTLRPQQRTTGRRLGPV